MNPDAENDTRSLRRHKISGRVIGVDVGEWAGFTAGVIYLQRDDGERFELRYTRNTSGSIPDVGSEIIGEYTGEHIHTLIKLEQLSESSLDRLTSRSTASSHHAPLFSKPPGAIALAASVMLSSIGLMLWGLFGDFHRKYSATSTAIYVFCGIVFFAFGLGVWYNSDRE
jgi:hypothetical protein